MKIKKGDYGYISSQKIKRGLTTFLGFALALGVLIAGIVVTGTRANIFTVLAIVGCLPSCQALVGFVMIMMEQPMDKALYEEIKPHTGELEMAYEACVTMEDAKLMLDAIAFCGNEIIAFASHPSDHAVLGKTEKHIVYNLKQDGYPVHCKIFDQKRAFLDRLDTLSSREIDPESIRDPEPASLLSYERRIRQHLLGISL